MKFKAHSSLRLIFMTEDNGLNEVFGRNTFISVKELASWLRVSTDCLYKNISSGKLAAIKLGGPVRGRYRITREAVEKFVEEHQA